MKICFIDDRNENLESWRVAMLSLMGSDAELACFCSVPKFTEAVDCGYRPDVVFTDFFIGGKYGSEVIEYSRNVFGDGVCLIAHSSMERANAGMVRLGADFAVPKVKGQSPSPTIAEFFQSKEMFVESVSKEADDHVPEETEPSD